MLKGWQLGCEERPFYIKGSFVGCEGMSGMGFRHAIEGIKGVRAHSLSEVAEMEARATEEASWAHVREDAGVACYHGGDWRVSEALPTKARALITDEALTVEASRYEPYLTDFGGFRDFFSSTPFGCDRALVVRGPSGLDETVEGVGFQAPLCAMLNDASLWVMDSEEEKSKGNKSDAIEEMQEREIPSSKWDESRLVKFSKSLGFSKEGIEGEILKLLLRLKTRRYQGKKKGTLELTRFDREVKKLDVRLITMERLERKGMTKEEGTELCVLNED